MNWDGQGLQDGEAEGSAAHDHVFMQQLQIPFQLQSAAPFFHKHKGLCQRPHSNYFGIEQLSPGAVQCAVALCRNRESALTHGDAFWSPVSISKKAILDSLKWSVLLLYCHCSYDCSFPLLLLLFSLFLVPGSEHGQMAEVLHGMFNPSQVNLAADPEFFNDIHADVEQDFSM